MVGTNPNPFFEGVSGNGPMSLPPIIMGIPVSGTNTTAHATVGMLPISVALHQLPRFLLYHLTYLGAVALPRPLRLSLLWEVNLIYPQPSMDIILLQTLTPLPVHPDPTSSLTSPLWLILTCYIWVR